MDFSKKYLLKYGWEEGQGLGKMKDGIKIAIKPKLKFDKAGMGFDPSLEFTDNWWIRKYNDALDMANVINEEKNKCESYGEEHKEKVKIKKRKSREESLTDMFIACEGRTLHKGARQGLHLSGKLQRLELQELKFIPKKKHESNVKTESGTTDSFDSVYVHSKRTEEENKTRKHKRKDKFCCSKR